MGLTQSTVTVTLDDIHYTEMVASQNNQYLGITESGDLILFHTMDIEGIVEYCENI